MSVSTELARREGQEGSRWANKRPSGEEVAAWFKENVTLHEGMDHEDWVGGITLIESTERHDEVTGFTDDNRPIIVPDVQHIYYVPYPKVETRIAYFNRLAEQHEDWRKFIIPVAAANSHGLHVGYTLINVPRPSDGKTVTLVVYTARALMMKSDHDWQKSTDADGVEREYPVGDVVMEGIGTKSVPLTDRHGQVDPDAFAKAQTGAFGRALGAAGILVIPGTGVATAEDMQETRSMGNIPGAASMQDSAYSAPEGDARIEEGDADEALRRRALQLMAELKQDHPKALAEFQAWARERKPPLPTLNALAGAPLKGVVKKLEKALDAAQRTAPADPWKTQVDITGG